jgi:adenosine deaminase
MDKLYRDWPKIDLHRHLEGSMRLSTIRELAVYKGLELPFNDEAAFKAEFQFSDSDVRSLSKFISKFIWLRRLITNADDLSRITYEAVEDAALDNVKYLELRFNYFQLVKRGLDSRDIMRALNKGIEKAKDKYDIEVGLICGISRELPVDCAEKTVDFAIHNIENGIVAIDLMNDESYPPDIFTEQFKKAREAGLYVTVHAGEAAGPINIVNSIMLLGADRIGHGSHMFYGEDADKIALDKNVLIECCLTSNIQTGAIEDIHNHPIKKMNALGIPTCICTDDPGVSDIDLTHEYCRAEAELGLSPDELSNILMRTIDYIFRPELKAKLKKELNSYFNVITDFNKEDPV